jgi:hypothetical protein
VCNGIVLEQNYSVANLQHCYEKTTLKLHLA